MSLYTIDIERNVLKLLGSQMYGDMPSVISELVANSYDAGATKVWISLDTKLNKIIIEDNGEGMSVDDINNHFLKVGYHKRDDSTVISRRNPMGRKGIGKLAAFSLSNEMCLYSSKQNEKAGCILDFKKITEENTNPEAISSDLIIFENEKLSENGSGTRIELLNISKRVAYSYRFIINKLARLFDINSDDFTIFIKKDNEQYKPLHRQDLDYFSIMDCILTIGCDDYYQRVLDNNIDSKYKILKKYDEFIGEQSSRRNALKKFPYSIQVEDSDGNVKDIAFSFTGWIGTVSSLQELKKVQINVGEQQKDQIDISDNRLSIFSRGKLGEYDILPKIKSNTNVEAYVVGEFYIDLFEDDSLSDMAISNRRGYEETDSRYIEAIKVIKRMLAYVVKLKNHVNKVRTEDEKAAITEELKKKFIENDEVKDIIKTKLNDDDKLKLQKASNQFMRAVNNQDSTKKVFISHKSEEAKFGQFIVDVLEDYGVDVCKNVIFTSERNSRLGIPLGQDIFDYLKGCFRDDLYVIFLFSKAFYDSVPCIAEVGAAWATNQNSINVVIDIEFSNIERPTNSNGRGIDITKVNDVRQLTTIIEFFDCILREGIGESNPDHDKIKNSVENILAKEEYKMVDAFTPQVVVPTRNFMPKPICSKCKNEMRLEINEKGLIYSCSNKSCNEELQVSM